MLTKASDVNFSDFGLLIYVFFVDKSNKFHLKRGKKHAHFGVQGVYQEIENLTTVLIYVIIIHDLSFPSAGKNHRSVSS